MAQFRAQVGGAQVKEFLLTLLAYFAFAICGDCFLICPVFQLKVPFLWARCFKGVWFGDVGERMREGRWASAGAPVPAGYRVCISCHY